MCPGIFGYRGTLLYIPCDVISITCELGVVFRVNEISRSKPLHCSIPCILMRTFMSDWYKIRRTYKVRTFSWRLDERIIVCPVPGNDGAWWTCIPPRRWPRAERLGYPTGQCLECRPAKDPGYAGHMAKSIIPLETGTKAIEPVPGSMRRKRAAELLGAGVGAVHDRVKAYRGGGVAALRPENRNSGQPKTPT